ncbi:MAG: hypothetical protein LBQ79_07570 [Deltaproteobacteria bacterium]|jgi:hypothetical protein|nr:hypothetical protein [Deltaproteobacteria bacterium]
MAKPLTEQEEISNSILLERPARPFHCWLSFRCGDWPALPAEEVGLPHLGSSGMGAAICYMTHGFFAYAMENRRMSPRDYEVWYVDRVAKVFLRLKSFGSAELDPDCKYSVPGWAAVSPDWTGERKIFDQPEGTPDPCGMVLMGRAAELFEAKWAEWTGGPITVTPSEFTLDDDGDGTVDRDGDGHSEDPDDGDDCDDDDDGDDDDDDDDNVDDGDDCCDDDDDVDDADEAAEEEDACVMEFIGKVDGGSPEAVAGPSDGKPGGGPVLRARTPDGNAPAPGETV